MGDVASPSRRQLCIQVYGGPFDLLQSGLAFSLLLFGHLLPRGLVTVTADAGQSIPLTQVEVFGIVRIDRPAAYARL